MIYFHLIFWMSTSLLGFRGCWGFRQPCNPKGPVRILDSFMIRVLATSGSEVEALAVIRAVQALASALRINRALTQLRLHGNDVGVQGVQAHKIASNTSQDCQVWGVSNTQWHVGTLWCRNCQALASAYSALMVNRVVAADWNQAMLCAVVKFGSCNELTTFITLTRSMQFKTVWCLKRLWLMRCRTSLRTQTNYAGVRSGHRRAFRPGVMCSNEGFSHANVLQTQDPWSEYIFQHLVTDMLRKSLVERSVVVGSWMHILLVFRNNLTTD